MSPQQNVVGEEGRDTEAPLDAIGQSSNTQVMCELGDLTEVARNTSLKTLFLSVHMLTHNSTATRVSASVCGVTRASQRMQDRAVMLQGRSARGSHGDEWRRPLARIWIISSY